MQTELFDQFYELEDQHWWFVGRRMLVIDLLAHYGDLCDGSDGCQPDSILDIGCGTGGLLPHLQRLAPSFGVDTSAEAVQYCRDRGVAVTLGSGLQLPFADQTFGGVVALDVIEHLDDDVAILKEAYRVLRPGGTAVITVPAIPWLWSSHDEVNNHRRRYMRGGLNRALAAAGFKNLKTSYYNLLLLPLVIPRKIMHQKGSHLEALPSPINAILRTVLASERSLIRRSALPLGASLIAVVQRPAEDRALSSNGALHSSR